MVDYCDYNPLSKNQLEKIVNSLTETEREVYDMLLKFVTNQEIAEVLGMNPKTLPAHVNNIYEKFGIIGEKYRGLKRFKLMHLCMRRFLRPGANAFPIGYVHLEENREGKKQYDPGVLL